MIFYSFEFIVFFTLVFFIYYFAGKFGTKLQNYVLLFSSYFFYGWANWKIIPVLIISTTIFYFLGILSEGSKSEPGKRIYTTLCVLTGVGLLLYFKYTNFFIASFNDLLKSFGFQNQLETLHILLPLGISFFTFRLLSYIFDLQRAKYPAERDFIRFSTYVSFFPGILSGPIDRADSFLPQLKKRRIFDYDLAVIGSQQILWGAFKKIVVADNLASFVNQVYGSYSSFSGATLIVVAILYTFQMYADFSGYTDMAIGVSKILGIKMAKNFNFPLFSQNIADFWRRWHISLTSWLTDYVFMPLNVKWRNWGKRGMILAIILNFLICGLWHGDNWTFVVWGAYHGLLFIPLILGGFMFKKVKVETTRFYFPTWSVFVRMITTFMLVTLGLVLFRANNLAEAFRYIYSIFSNFSPDLTYFISNSQIMLMTAIAIFSLGIMILVEWSAFVKKEEYIRIKRIKVIAIFLLLVLMGSYKDQMSFIYFNF
jgi:D-alanyl-lipoteichoic acid acyltransferase DltB (MBOAT superfamily)